MPDSEDLPQGVFTQPNLGSDPPQGEFPPTPPPPFAGDNWVNGPNNMINGANNLVFAKGV